MKSDERRDGWSRTLPLLRGAALVVIVGGLRVAAPVVLPILVACLLAVLSFPLLDWLRRRRVPRWVAVLLAVLANVAVFTAVGLVLSGAINQFAAAWPGYQQLLVDRAKAAIDTLREHQVDLSQWLSPDQIDPAGVLGVAQGIVGGTVRGAVSIVSFVGMTLLALVFVLAEAAAFPNKLHRALGGRESGLANLERVTRQFQRYLGIKTAISAATGLLVFGWTTLLGVDFPVVWGMLAFFLNYIPTVGSILAAVPPVLLVMAQAGVGRALLVALGYLVVNFALGNMLEPLLMGRRFGLSPLAVLLALVFWGFVWGPIGMILSIPLTMIIRIGLEQTDQLRWLAMLLGPESSEATEEADG